VVMPLCDVPLDDLADETAIHINVRLLLALIGARRCSNWRLSFTTRDISVYTQLRRRQGGKPIRMMADCQDANPF
jgi:hypothetical protein